MKSSNVFTVAIVTLFSVGSVLSYIPSDKIYKAKGYRLKLSGNVVNSVEEKPKRRSPLEEYPRVNPHEKFQASPLKEYWKKFRPQYRMRPRIFDPEAITSFISMLHGGMQQESYPPAAPPEPVIPPNLPEVIPVPVPFSVSPVRLIFPAKPKDTEPHQDSKATYGSRRRSFRRRKSHRQGIERIYQQ